MPDEVPKEDEEKAQKTDEKKTKKKMAFTKVVMRRLPPNYTKEQLLNDLGEIPSYNYFRFVRGDVRAYFNFLNQDDVILFRDKYDGLEFTDSTDKTEQCVVEYSGFQKIPKKKKVDSKIDTIENDADYVEFLEALQQEEEKTVLDLELYLDELEKRDLGNKGAIETPLISFIKTKREERRKLREERRRIDLEKRRKRDERKRREIERKRKIEAEKKKKQQEDKEEGSDGNSDKEKDSARHQGDVKNKDVRNREFDKDDRRGYSGKPRKDDWKDKRPPARFRRDNRPVKNDIARSPPGSYQKHPYRKWDKEEDSKAAGKSKRPDREIYNPQRSNSGKSSAKPQKYSEQRSRVFTRTDG